MRTWYYDTNMTYNSRASWVLYPLPKGSSFSSSQCRLYEVAILELSKLSMKDRSNFTSFNKALLDRGFGSQTKSSHERLQIGDIVQVLLEPELEHKSFPSKFISSKGRPVFFLIGGFIQDKDGTNWALVKHCKLLSPSNLSQMRDAKLSPYITIRTPNFFTGQANRRSQYLELSEKIRKVGVVHKCTSSGCSRSSCSFTSRATRITHSQTTLGGGDFYILNNMLAYPPRRS